MFPVALMGSFQNIFELERCRFVVIYFSHRTRCTLFFCHGVPVDLYDKTYFSSLSSLFIGIYTCKQSVYLLLQDHDTQFKVLLWGVTERIERPEGTWKLKFRLQNPLSRSERY